MVENGLCDSVCDSAAAGMPKGRSAGRRLASAGLLVVALSLAGCTHLHWPWHRKPPPPPTLVHEVDEASEGGAEASFPQYWLRNTLIVDLQGASGSGSVTLKPRAGTAWPVRIAVKVMPGSIGELEVSAAQRTVLPVSTAGVKPIVLELSPGIYVPKTPAIKLSWGPNPVG